jgi:hypothetical protein
LERAKKALEGMRGAKSFPDFEEQWREYLRRLERVWGKAAAHYARSPKWKRWRVRHEAQRSEDALLRYLCSARGADEHTVEDIVEKEPGTLAIRAAKDGPMYIRRLSISKGNVYLDADNAEVLITPERARLLPIKTRSKVIPVPGTHLGAPMDSDNVIDVATKGLEFYERLLMEIEAEFVD